MKDISPGEDLFNLQAVDEAGNLMHGYSMTLDYVQILCISDLNHFVWKFFSDCQYSAWKISESFVCQVKE